MENSRENYVQNPQQVGDTSIASEKEISNNLSVNKTNTSKGFPDSEDFYTASQNIEPLVDISASSQTAIPELYAKLPVTCGSFPKSAQVFVDAIKKNRSCQKFIRSKLIQIEARIEENKKLKDRVKILKDFQVSCQRRTNRALSQKKDPRVQLISVPKLRSPKIPKVSSVFHLHSMCDYCDSVGAIFIKVFVVYLCGLRKLSYPVKYFKY